MLWRLIGQALAAPAASSGRIEISRSKQNGRMVRMRGIRQIRRGWLELIADATLDHRLLKPIWLELEPYEPITVALPPGSNGAPGCRLLVLEDQDQRRSADRGGAEDTVSASRPGTPGRRTHGLLCGH